MTVFATLSDKPQTLDSVVAAPRQPVRSPRPSGALLGRPDLSDEALLAAIAERLVFEGRDPSHAPGVLKAAIAGKPLALAMLRKLVLPAPQSALVMPIQSILRERSGERSTSSWSKLVSFGR